MRVTLFHMGFPEYVMGLANALADIAEVTVIHPEGLSATCRTLALPTVQLWSFAKPLRRREIGNLWAMQHALELIRESKPEVVHVQETFDYGYDLYSLFNRFPVLVTTVHDVVPHPGDGHAAPGLQYTKAISFWRSQRLIAHTDGMRSQLSARYRIAPERIDVIPHGELGSLYLTLAERADVSPVQREPFTLLFFGRIWAYKGLRYLLQAFAILKRDLPEVKLVIAGRGGDLQANAGLLASLRDVEVMDEFIPEQQVAGLFQKSSIVVLPYIEASQSGVSAIGFTLGTVVVASRVGGLAELIVEGETGVLVPPRDAQSLAASLLALLQEPDRQGHIRRQAYEYGKIQLAWEGIAQSTFNTYNKALRSRRTS